MELTIRDALAWFRQRGILPALERNG